MDAAVLERAAVRVKIDAAGGDVGVAVRDGDTTEDGVGVVEGDEAVGDDGRAGLVKNRRIAVLALDADGLREADGVVEPVLRGLHADGVARLRGGEAGRDGREAGGVARVRGGGVAVRRDVPDVAEGGREGGGGFDDEAERLLRRPRALGHAERPLIEAVRGVGDGRDQRPGAVLAPLRDGVDRATRAGGRRDEVFDLPLPFEREPAAGAGDGA